MTTGWPIGRRSFLLGLGELVAAPAIVRAASLMPVKAWRAERYGCLAEIISAKTWYGYSRGGRDDPTRVWYQALDGTFAGVTALDRDAGSGFRDGDIVWVEGDKSRVVPVRNVIFPTKCVDPTATIALRERPRTEMDRFLELFVETMAAAPGSRDA